MFTLPFDTQFGTLVKNKFGEKYIYAINRNSFEQYSSQVLYQQLFQHQFKKENTLYLIIGTDSGLLVNYLSTNPPEKGSSYLFIEFPEVIEKLLLDFPQSENSRIHLTDYEHWLQVAEQYEFANYLFINKVVVVHSYAVIDNYLPVYKQLWKQIEQELSDKRWQACAKTGTRLFIQTQLDNINENLFSAFLLKDKFKNKTAVILAGGPSLDLYIEWVEENRDKLIVFAVSRIAKRLLNTSIIPDFFVSIDPNDVSYDVSKEMLYFSKKSILLNQYHIVPKLLQQWQGLNFYIGPLYPWINPDQTGYIEASGPTVTNVALDAAMFMGINRLILIGVDLCFSPEGYSHASNSIEHAIGTMSSYSGQLVTTNNNQQAETENSFFNAIKSLTAQAERANKQNCQFINPSPHATKIDGVNHILLEDIELIETTGDINKVVRKVLPEDLLAAKKEHYLSIIKEIKIKQKELKEIIKLTKKGLSYNESFFKNDEPENNFIYKIKMDKLEKKLNKQYLSLSAICRFFGIQSFLKFFKPAHDINMDNSELKKWGDTYYEAYKVGSIDLSKSLKECILRTKIRIDELEQTSDLIKIIEFWLKDNTPGRALTYKENHSLFCKELPLEQKDKLTHCIELYDQMISTSSDESAQHKRIKVLYDLSGSEIKAHNMFHQHDILGLQRMVKSLEKHPDKRAIPLRHLVQGYLYELSKQTNDAIIAYQNAIEEPALEPALKQIILIAINKNDFLLAEKAIEHLCGKSLSYLPQLARIYKIQKRDKDALDAYTLYLEHFPEDIPVLLKLGQFYQELNEIEAAEFVYKHVLTLDKANIMAETYLSQLQLIN